MRLVIRDEYKLELISFHSNQPSNDIAIHEISQPIRIRGSILGILLHRIEILNYDSASNYRCEN